MKLTARAPSNIALVKYMGKRAPGAQGQAVNLPENPSLSMTLDALCTVVEAELAPPGAPGSGDQWLPGRPALALKYQGADLAARGIERALKHLARVHAEAPAILAAHGILARAAWPQLRLKSANTFPAASGIASSASAFAAITLVGVAAAAADTAELSRALQGEGSAPLRRALARLSRAGSGSSCRSFEGPWVAWRDADAGAVPARMPALRHFVILVSSEAKGVSSSEAHARVKSSPLWQGRVERATARVGEAERALVTGDLAQLSRLAWAESWEMHSLFHTCAPPFTYWLPSTLETLCWLEPRIGSPDGPIVTMDAGPNVHVIVPESRAASWRDELAARFGAGVLEDAPGAGATLMLG